MKRNKLFLFIVFLLTSLSMQVFATAAQSETLIYKGDTLMIFSNPLEQLYRNGTSRPRIFGDKDGCPTTSCWNGYTAEWIIVNDELYLSGIFSCCFDSDSIKADLGELFGDKYKDGKVKADWFNGSIIAPQGKLLFYVHMGYESLYERDLELQFDNGRLLGTKIHDNSKSKKSIYSLDSKKAASVIYSNINWSKLPDLDGKKLRVILQFSANVEGVIDSVWIVKGYNKLLDEAAVKAIKSIPEWDVYYRHGKHKRIVWTYPIIFSDDNRIKYSQKQ